MVLCSEVVFNQGFVCTAWLILPSENLNPPQIYPIQSTVDNNTRALGRPAQLAYRES
jgi:hypothetical protein